MENICLDKWDNYEEMEGVIFFAQCFCEMLSDETLDSYKAPALNLHLSILELFYLANMYKEGILNKGSIKFSVDEFLCKVEEDIVFTDGMKDIIKSYANEIKNLITKQDINKSKMLNLISSATSDLNQYLSLLKSRIIEECKNPRMKKNIRKLCQDIIVEILLIGFSRRYALAKARKFFFSPSVAPVRLSRVEQLNDFLDFFDERESSWEVHFIGSKIPKEFTSHMNIFQARRVMRTPAYLSEDEKYTSFKSKKRKHEVIYSVVIDARDPHDARESAEYRLRFFTDVCRFHQHNATYTLEDRAFVYSFLTKKSFFIDSPKKPMQCGATLKRAENIELFKHTLEILQGEHFQDSSIRAFHKVLDFHHAAISSSDYENQLLDLWAALEGFLPPPDGSTDRITWYLNYLMPPLILAYNEKIILEVATPLASCAENKIGSIIDELPSSGDRILDSVRLLSCAEYAGQRTRLLSAIDKNPLFRNRLDTVSKIYHSTKTIRHNISNHEKKIKIHIQRIYTLRNQIIHNASSLPYIKTLVENLHDYLDTVMLSVSLVGIRSNTKLSVDAALEKMSIIDKCYRNSISGDVNVNINNCEKIIFGENNVLSKYGYSAHPLL